jgi:lysyl-tRNA synthetase class 2
MKRMLAAGSGSIYQLCKVFRDGERGARHNPEFTLLEWYRVGFDHLDLMDEVEQLVTAVLSGILPISSVRHWSYRELFVEMAGIDPFTAETQALAAVLDADIGFAVVGLTGTDRDAWLDLIMTHIIEPRLGDGLVFIRDYPASQAALARVRPGDPQVASRFEVYLNGMELANGFHELSDATEQAQRFEQELARRREAGIVTVDIDDHLLAALQAGLPDCAGVALGVDRLLMCACGAQHIQDVIAFPFEVA